MEYNPYIKTALKRKTISTPTKYLLEHNLLKGNILDFGCGNGKDTIELNNLGYKIIGYDKYNLIYSDKNKLNRKYDTIICNYVFNVIYSLKEHKQTLKLLKSLSNNIYIAVRNDKRAIKDTWKYILTEDCYETTTKSYQRFYNNETLKKYFGDFDIVNKTSSYILFKINKLNGG